MPAVVEKYNSRHQIRGINPAMEVGYLMLDYLNENAAIDAMLAFAPATWNIGTLDLPLFNPEATEIGPYIWDGKLTWGYGSIEQTISFDTTGNRAKVTQSLNTVSYTAPGIAAAPDFQGAIGVTKTGIEGAETVVPGMTFVVKKTIPPDLVNPSLYAGLTGSYNDAPFMGFAAGEVRFDGAQGDQKQIGQNVDVSFHFTASPNATDFTVAGITGINKLGWQYLWVLYEESEDDTASFLVQRPVAVYVEDLPNCQPADFSTLGIGTTLKGGNMAKKLEYLDVTITPASLDVGKELALLGDLGWELVEVLHFGPAGNPMAGSFRCFLQRGGTGDPKPIDPQ